jgi:hypothetical protein
MPRVSGLRGLLTRRIEVMSKLLGWLAATTIGVATVTVTSALAFQGGGFGGGMGGMRMSRQVFVGGAPRFVGAPCAGRHFVDGAFFYDCVPYYYGYVPYYGNYCWQQVWTPSGWQWVDACAGYYGYGY